MSGNNLKNEITKQEKKNEEIREFGAQMLDLIGKFHNLLEKRLGKDNE